MKDLDITGCAICGGPLEAQPRLQRNFTFPAWMASPPRVCFCDSCSIYQLNPLPTETDYARVYGDSYFTAENDGFYENSREDRLRVYAAKLDRLSEFFPAAKTLIDIGAGEGDFLSLARTRYRCFAVEYSAHGTAAIQRMGNVAVLRGSSTRVADFAEKFDVIFMHHVFEHLTNPVEFLRILRNCMHNQSVFLFEIPNQFDSLVFNARQLTSRHERFSGLFSLHHPFMYTKNGIAELLRRNGFKLLSITTAPRERQVCANDGTAKALARRFAIYPLQALLEAGSVIEVACTLE